MNSRRCSSHQVQWSLKYSTHTVLLRLKVQGKLQLFCGQKVNKKWLTEVQIVSCRRQRFNRLSMKKILSLKRLWRQSPWKWSIWIGFWRRRGLDSFICAKSWTKLKRSQFWSQILSTIFFKNFGTSTFTSYSFSNSSRTAPASSLRFSTFMKDMEGLRVSLKVIRNTTGSYYWLWSPYHFSSTSCITNSDRFKLLKVY